ncbi:hypothetical protein [Pedobacter sp.]|uniref:hypothetical protein n=1 Tax=Pedobacter sp. TaxID=1411316 RepID=UPI0031DDD74D
MTDSINNTVNNVDELTLEEISKWLSLHLAEELRWVEDLNESNDLIKSESLHPVPGRSFLVATKDCIATCFMLKSEGFSAITTPYYGKEGLFSKMKDGWGNTYLIKEERSYRFELSI